MAVLLSRLYRLMATPITTHTPRLGEDVAEGHPKVLGVTVDVQHLHQKACDEPQHPP